MPRDRRDRLLSALPPRDPGSHRYPAPPAPSGTRRRPFPVRPIPSGTKKPRTRPAPYGRGRSMLDGRPRNT